MKEAIIRIEKLLKRTTVITGIIISVLIFSTCKNGFEILPEQPGMTKVTITVTNNGGRTVFPDLSGLEITRFELLGCFKDNENSGFGENSLLFDSFNVVESVNVDLEPGIWGFTVNAYETVNGTDRIVLYGYKEAAISEGGGNLITISLLPLKDSGTGTINISFTYPNNMGVTVVSAILNSDSDPEIEGMVYYSGNAYCGQSFSTAINTDNFIAGASETKFIFQKDNVPVGVYFITFNFGTGTASLRTVSELVQVRSNLTSKKDITIKNYTVTVTEGNTLETKLNWINNNAQDDVEYIIEIENDIVLNTCNLYCNNAKNVIVTLRGIEGTKTISIYDSGSLFIVNSGVTLILDSNITLIGNKDGNNASVVEIKNGGTLIMREESSIGRNNFSSYGGGVSVYGTFTMNGGSISSNAGLGGGGVYVADTGIFTMNLGTISSSTAQYGGGVYVKNGGTFTMNGGEIDGNRAKSGGGGVFVSEQGIFNKVAGGGTISTYDSVNIKGNKVLNDNNDAIYGYGHAMYIALPDGKYIYKDSDVLPNDELFYDELGNYDNSKWETGTQTP